MATYTLKFMWRNMPELALIMGLPFYCDLSLQEAKHLGL